MTTRRERMEARAERRREWAQGRDDKASQAWDASRSEVQHLPLGQPILVGHHSERGHRRMLERAHRKTDQAVEHMNMRDHHAAKAEGIERQLKTTIYSDDPDALEQLDAKIARLEAERDGIKAYNKTAKAGRPDPSLMGKTELQVASDLRHVWQAAPTLRDGSPNPKAGQYPSYALTNLGGNIRRLKQRRDSIAAKAAQA